MFSKPILITGIHRSGSTWMGKIFELASELRYVHEPFNITKHSHSPFDTWFYYINEATPPKKAKEIDSYLKSFEQWSLSELVKHIKKAKYAGQPGISQFGIWIMYCWQKWGESMKNENALQS